MRFAHISDSGGLVRGFPLHRNAGIRHRARTNLLTATVNHALKHGKLTLDPAIPPNFDPFGVRTPAGLFSANLTWTEATGAVRVAAQTMSRRGDVLHAIAWLRRGAPGSYIPQHPLQCVRSWLQIEDGSLIEMPIALARILAVWTVLPAGEFLPNGTVIDFE